MPCLPVDLGASSGLFRVSAGCGMEVPLRSRGFGIIIRRLFWGRRWICRIQFWAQSPLKSRRSNLSRRNR